MTFFDAHHAAANAPYSGTDIAASAQQPMHASARYVVSRTLELTPSFVLKTVKPGAAAPAASVALRREFALLDQLHLPGIVQVVALVQTGDELSMVMADAGGHNLQERVDAGALEMGEFCAIALQLAQALARLHQQGILHGNLTPANIVWNAATRVATLVDFSAARLLAADASGQADPGAASLAYLSPEQTGRTGRSVDTRSDLYMLGVTFYVLLTGALPFTAQDPVEWMHAHLARRPQPPATRNAAIPAVVSDMVVKLLEKEPEQRYASAAALLADLAETCRQWFATGTVQPFALAQQDIPRQLVVPDVLYGRAAVIDALKRAFDRSGIAPRELILVAGAPGIGKSAVVQQLEQYVNQHKGHFISGKCDQLQRSVPYEGLAQAFRMLVRQLLTHTDAALADWRERITGATFPNAQLLIDVIPEIDVIIGPQAPVAALGPIESRNRFNQVFTSFLGVFSRRDHPFVLFLDDLQWVDAASLQLMRQWLVDDTAGRVLIVGAYRRDEVGATHALALALAELRSMDVPVSELLLLPLDRDELTELLAATLNRPADACAPLADLMHAKTAGNPFFIRQLLHALHVDGLFRFIPATRSWEWEMPALERAPVSDNVLDLMVNAIARLPEATRKLVQVAACIGYRFELALLAEVSGDAPAAALQLLWPALQDGLLVLVEEAGDNAVLQFVHDRVQQAAYALLDELPRWTLHRAIGVILLHRMAQDDTEKRLFDMLHHMNRGAALMTDPAERLQVAQCNLAAGRKAKDSAAYQAAFDYLSAGKDLLPPPAWEALPELTFAMHRELAECAYLAGLHGAAELTIELALAHAPDAVAKADLYGLRVLAATVAGDWAGALRWGREGLALLGNAWPEDTLAEANDAESAAVMQHVGARRIADLVHQSEVVDDETRACLRLLALLGPPAYFSGSAVLTFLVARGVNLSLLHGPSVHSAYAYVFYGAIHNARTGALDIGYAFGKLALNLARRFDNGAEESRTVEVFGLVVHAWCAPLQESLPLMREGHRVGLESGELAYAAFNLCGILINGLPAGVPLDALSDDAATAIEFATRHQNRTAIEISLPFQQFARALTGQTAAPGSFDDAAFAERQFLEQAAGNQTAIGQYWVARLQAAYLAGDIDAARLCSVEGATCLATGILGMVTCAEHALYTALTLAAAHDAAPPALRPALLLELDACHQQFVVWSHYCPENFQHKRWLIAAEMARIAGAPWQAATSFRAAIAGARQSGFIQDGALANELAGRFFLANEQPEIAAVYLAAALQGYRKWGATAKADALHQRHAGHLGAAPDTGADAGAPIGPGRSLDALALIKASQAIAAETISERLFERILQVVLEVAGAQTGVLLLGEPRALRVRGRIGAGAHAAVALEDSALEDDDRLPQEIIRYVARTRQALVLGDAATDERFAAAHDHLRGLRSVLCVPLMKQVQVVGMLFLENSGMAHAFTTASVEVVQALAAQAAISLENATLLAERAGTERDLRQLASDLAHENRRKTEFLATLAHELRNPLAPIRNGLDLMRLSGSNTPAATRVHEMMGRQLNQMVHLIDDLLDIARINSGKVQLKLERLDLRGAITSAVEAALPAMKAAQQTFDIAMPEAPVLLHGDSTRLAQIFSNLLANATKYTPRAGHIEVRVAVDAQDVEITIADTGLGIPPEALSDVFNMFNQVSKNLGRSQGGLGIGLALVRGLVHMHGGAVTAASSGEGQGSTFRVRLPLLHAGGPDRAAAAAASAWARPAAAQQRLNVLVADDNVDAAHMIMALLEMAGHTVELAHDGRTALEKVGATGFDLAILDIGMPGRDGYEVAAAIRAMPGREHMFLAALTGWGAEEDRSRSRSAGFDAHLTKPAGYAEIDALLAASLKKAQLRR